MNDYVLLALARVVHVIAVVLWIGGVAMVTTVILPAARRQSKQPNQHLNPVEWFEQIEGRFAWQAKVTTLLTGISGLYLLYGLNAWSRFGLWQYWWLHAMVFVWAVFTLLLFVLEPLLLHRLYHHYGQHSPIKTLRFIQVMHWLLLLISLLTVAGAVAGSHGWFWLLSK